MSGGLAVHLFDAHVYIFRAWTTLPPMSAPDGSPTAAAYGFTNTLLKFLRTQRPTHAALAFDYALTSFRNDIEPEYKSGRTEAPPDLEPQFDLCVEISEALGLSTFEVEDFEADDVIATLADQCVAGGARVVVVSADKDLCQLVTQDGSVVFHDLARKMTLEAAGVRAKFGVEPDQIPDLLGLEGDPVDNLPGVPGVGRKGASAALKAFGRIEDIPPDPGAWRGVQVRGAARMAKSIDEYRDVALRSRELATVRRDVPGIRVRPEELHVRPPDFERLDAIFDRLGWQGIRDRVPGR